ncbi:MAG: type IV secretory system conjugative DNA transfer family protein [Proteobacteria bacterium]|nr:type IV secretory system conjugative DNA transfer family protein [Pseudomonadota bacterium]
MAKQTDEEFEKQLRRDLPRAQERIAKSIGLERGLSARWLQPDELTAREWTTPDGLLLGTRIGKSVTWTDDRHLLTIAGSRAGKGVSLIVPNLINYEGSVLVIDPKGENAARTARHRGKGCNASDPGLQQDVHVLDPFGESGLPADLLSSFNPLEAMDANKPEVIEDIGLFADALITHPDSGERHWTESAQGLLRALILVVVGDPRFKDRRNLITVRKLLSLTDPEIEQVQIDDLDRQRHEAKVAQRAKAKKSGEDLPELKDDEIATRELSDTQALIKLLKRQATTKYGDICEGMGQQLEDMSERERGSVLSAARTQTQWLDSPMMKGVLEHSKFKLGDIKRKKMSLYLCLPASRMGTHARWLRLIVMLAISVMERVKVKAPLPVLFVLDEFAVLGYMPSIETAAGLMAGFQVKLWLIVQNIGQLQRHYQHSWQTFVANAGVVTAFGVADTESLRVLSDFLGRTGIVTAHDSGASRDAQMHGARALQEDRREVPLLAEHELRRIFSRGEHRILILSVESEPFVARRLIYYDDPLFAGLFDPDPKYAAKP